MKQDRLAAIEALRGIAALLVAIFHFYYVLGINTLYPTPARLIQHFGYAIELFFLISAFTMMYTYERSATNRTPLFFLIKRYFRIAPLFYFCITLNLLIFMWSHSDLPFPYDPMLIVANISLLFNLTPVSAISLTPAGWTIGVEIIFYLLFPLIAVLAARRWILATLFLGFSLLAYTSKYLLPASPFVDQASASYFNLYCALNFMPVFIAGILLYKLWKYVSSDVDVTAVHRYAALSMYVFLGFVGLILYDVFATRFLHYIWAAAFAFLVISSLLKPNRIIVNRITTYFGKISYSLYLLHVIVMVYVPRQVLAFGFLSGIDSQGTRVALQLIIWFSTLTLLSNLTFRFVESPFNHLAAALIGRIQSGTDRADTKEPSMAQVISSTPKSAMGFWTKQPLGRNGISSPFGEARLRRSSPAVCSEGYFCRRRWDFRRF